MVPPVGSEDDPVTAITTKFVKTVYNKQRCPIFCTTVRRATCIYFSSTNALSVDFVCSGLQMEEG